MSYVFFFHEKLVKIYLESLLLQLHLELGPPCSFKVAWKKHSYENSFTTKRVVGTTFASSLILKIILALPTTLCVVGILITTSAHIYIFQGLLMLSIATAIRAFNTQPVYDSESQQTTYSLISLGERLLLLLSVFLTFFFSSAVSLLNLGYIYLFVMVSSLITQYLLVPFSPRVVSYLSIPNSVSALIKHSYLIWLATIAGAAVEYSSPLMLRYFQDQVR